MPTPSLWTRLRTTWLDAARAATTVVARVVYTVLYFSVAVPFVPALRRRWQAEGTHAAAWRARPPVPATLESARRLF